MERNLEAEAAYAAAWQQWCLTSDDGKKRELEQVMDALQPKIAVSPKDPRWPAFIKTLPGYEQFWSGWHTDMMNVVNKLREDGC
jgi:hypothetical protein